ncbi:hypothetical protein FYJ38_24410 [Clostridium sp. WB02_MRS01]|uniref:hypothetical protein n=1 Tax=Clostridium sp. WB02_MRS01 TaxID=2605777 RepID=UPI0012B405D6|nr:hypothetical protein [Clostridium sp. WB02_MRS01]MSS11753.1 hypothetical protein [Clostridium sp. WB02_MRS01]
MNREQRRRQAKENGTNVNSKKNFVPMGTADISINEFKQNKDLKECDEELTNLYMEVYKWQEENKVKNIIANHIITAAMSYMDSLCSLRFDITPIEDVVLIRNTMGCISNASNYFLGLCANGEKVSVLEKLDVKTEYISIPLLEGAVIYERDELPEESSVDDLYAGFVLKHAHELLPFLSHSKPSYIAGDESYVFKVLLMLIEKTKLLLPEAQVNSTKFNIQI